MQTVTFQGIVDRQLVTIGISLNNPCGIYEPGQVLSGRVNLRLEEDVSLYAVYLWVIGQAEITWSDSPNSSAKTCFDYEIYMKECYALWGQGQGNASEQGRGQGQPMSPSLNDSSTTGTLSAGLHQFNFQHLLPISLPSSFESHAGQKRLERFNDKNTSQQIKGNVRYLLRVKLDSTSLAVRRMCHDCAFIVLRPLDLNTLGTVPHQLPSTWSPESSPNAHVRNPLPPLDECVHVHREVQPGCRWYPCNSGLISCTLRLDRRAFVPGEDISVNLDIENLNRREVSKSFVAMTQVVHIFTAGVRHSMDCDVFCISGGKVKAGDSAYYHDIIHIPPLPPSHLDGCNIIDVEYVIKVGVMLSGLSEAVVDLILPVVIGTVPLKHFIMPGLHMSPVHQRYNHTSGEIENFTEDDFANGLHRDVHLYYRCTYSRKTLSTTQSNNSHSNGTGTLIT